MQFSHIYGLGGTNHMLYIINAIIANALKLRKSHKQEIEQNLHNMQLQTEIVRKPNTFDNCSTYKHVKIQTHTHIEGRGRKMESEGGIIWHLINNEIENLRRLSYLGTRHM